MNGESVAAGLAEAEICAFRYPDAPWEPGSIPSGTLFREIASQDRANAETTAAADRGTQSHSSFAAPIRFEYPAVPGLGPDLSEIRAASEDGDDGPYAEDGVALAEPDPEREVDRHFSELLASECAKAEERGRRQGMEAGLAQGREEGRQAGREEATHQLRTGIEGERERLASQTAALLASFAGARDGYIHRLEQEAARLALAVAARVLRREAQADPLLLTGSVRVALGQLSASTAVRLRVPQDDLGLWTEALAHMPNLPIRPEVIGDKHLDPGDCRMETELGSVDLGLAGQLESLERRFFDRDRAAAEELSHEDAIADTVLEEAAHDR
jgi:flagellar assembly protein FliH